MTLFSVPALDELKVEVRIQFKGVTQGMYQNIPRTELVITLKPSESISLKMVPVDQPIGMGFTHKPSESDVRIPEAYKSLMLDVLKGNHSSFIRDDELEAAWQVTSSSLCSNQRGLLMSFCMYRSSCPYWIGSIEVTEFASLAIRMGHKDPTG
jgi:glucose-6-phosphate 1-dehydrogenase